MGVCKDFHIVHPQIFYHCGGRVGKKEKKKATVMRESDQTMSRGLLVPRRRRVK